MAGEEALGGYGSIIGAGITAATGLLGGLFQAQAEARKTKREILARGTEKGFETQSQGVQSGTTAQQNAFQQLIDSYKSILTK